MRTDCYTLIKDQEDRFYFIPSEQIERNEPIHDSYTNGRLVTASEAGDYSIKNFDGCAPDDIRKAGAEIFGEKFLDLDWDFDMDGSFYFENLEELGLENQEEDIRNFFAKWCDKNENFATGDYYTYWDGHNNVSILLSVNEGDFTPEYEELDDYEAAPILKAFGHVSEWQDATPGLKVAYYGGYEFIDSCWEGHIGSYEGVVLSSDERMDLAETEGSYVSESTTSERCGYPKNVKQVLTGFDTFEEAEEIAAKYGLQVSEFYKEDGWQMLYRNGRAFEALEYKPEERDDDYVFLRYETVADNEEWVVSTMRNLLDDCSTWEEAKKIYEKAEKVMDLMDDLEDDEALSVDHQLDVSEMLRVHTMRKWLDSKTWVIGVEYVEK